MSKSDYQLQMDLVKSRGDFTGTDLYTVYVDAGVVHSGNGSSLHPFKTIQEAYDHISEVSVLKNQPTKVCIVPGIYVESLVMTPDAARNCIFASAVPITQGRAYASSTGELLDTSWVEWEGVENKHPLVITNMTRAGWDEYLEDGGPTYGASGTSAYDGASLADREIADYESDIDLFPSFYGAHTMALTFDGINFKCTGANVVADTTQCVAVIGAKAPSDVTSNHAGAVSGITFKNCRFNYNNAGSGNMGFVMKNVNDLVMNGCADMGNDISMLNNCTHVEILTPTHGKPYNTAQVFVNAYNLRVINGGDLATEGSPYGMGAGLNSTGTFFTGAVIQCESFYGESEVASGPVFARASPQGVLITAEDSITLLDLSPESEDREDKKNVGMVFEAGTDVIISSGNTLKVARISCRDLEIRDGDIDIELIKCTGDLTIDPDTALSLDIGFCDVDGDFSMPGTAVGAILDVSHMYVEGNASMLSGTCAVDAGTFVCRGTLAITNATLELCVGGIVGAITSTGGTVTKRTLNIS